MSSICEEAAWKKKQTEEKAKVVAAVWERTWMSL